MSVRSLSTIAVCLLAAFAHGCGAQDLDSAGAAPASFDTGPGFSDVLALVDVEQPLGMVTGGSRDITVQLVDTAGRPRAGEAVYFAVLGNAPGSSLSADTATTDIDGKARVRLRAGSSVAPFSLRVSSSRATVQLEVTVQAAQQLTLSVGVIYAQKRAIDSRTVTLVPGSICGSLASDQFKQALKSAPTAVLLDASERASFKVQPEQSYSLLAWASDKTNSRLASSCVEVGSRLATSDAASAERVIDLVLVDNPLAVVAGRYDQLLTIDLSEPLALLGPAAKAVVQARLPAGNNASAAFYINLLEAAGYALGADRDPLLQRLNSALTKANAGPLVFGEALAQCVAARGAGATVSGALSLTAAADVASFQVSRLFSRASDYTAVEVALNTATLAKEATLSASYEEARAVVVIGSLSLRIGMGSYATRLLASLGGPNDMPNMLPQSHGCNELGAVLADNPVAAVTAAQATAVCQAGVATLANEIAAAWMQLDTDHPLIWLSGDLSVHDRDGNGQVDDVGPATLKGSWSRELAPAASQSVDATLSVPPPTVL